MNLSDFVIPLSITTIFLAPLSAARLVIELLVFIWPGKRWVGVLCHSIGPAVPFTQPTRTVVLRVFRTWLGVALGFFGLAALATLVVNGMPFNPDYALIIDLICYLFIGVGLFVGCLCLVESVWVIVRLLSCRVDSSPPPLVSQDEPSQPIRPPNNSMNPSAGGRAPAGL